MMLLNSEKAVTEVVGHVIIMGLTITGIALITLIGVPSIYKLQDMANVRNVEQAFTVLDSRVSRVSLGDAPIQVANINLGGGSISVEPNSSKEPSYMLIEMKNGTSAVNTTIINMGKIVYKLGDRELAYEGGGVWSKYPAGSVMLSPPEVHYNGITLTMPVVNISGGSSTGGKGVVSLNTQRKMDVKLIYPNQTLKNPLPNYIDQVNITIYSKYYDAWADYFREMTLVKVNPNPANKSVTISLGTPPLITNFSYGALASDTIHLGQSAEINSYNSTTGKYDDSQSSNGSIRANDEIIIENSAIVNGSALSHESIECGTGHNNCGEIKKDAYGTPVYVTPLGNLIVGRYVKQAVERIDLVDTLDEVTNRINEYKSFPNDNTGRCLSGADNRTLNSGSGSTGWSSGTCTIYSGNYYIKSFIMDTNGKENLIFDTSGGDVNIAVDIPGSDIIWKKANITVIPTTGNYNVKIYLNGGIVAGGGGGSVKINRYTNDNSSRIQIITSSSRDVTFQQSGTEFCGFVYAPKATIYVRNSAAIFGALVGKEFSVTQSQAIHFDEALEGLNTNLGTGTTIMYLQITRNDIDVSIS